MRPRASDTLPGCSPSRAADGSGTAPADDRIDWSQLWNPGPVRVFTDAELQRAGGDRPTRTLVTMTTITGVMMALALLQAVPPPLLAQVTGLLAGGLAVVGTLAKRLWRRPERRLLNLASWGFVLLGLLLGVSIGLGHTEREAGRWVVGVCMGMAVVGSSGLWFLTVYRSNQIAARLRELEDREHAADMARQLAAAQIQPHFLFNSLASLQHWVQVKDDRAAPLLESLSAFLRATLPLFNQARLRLGDEAEAVRRYLEVMALRLGDRLHFTVEVEPAAAGQQVPPGLLLTLVENAVEHGVQASLRGAGLRVQARAHGSRLVVTVQDTGPGLAPGAAEGLGLANSRARLLQAYGEAATLTLSDAEAAAARPGSNCP